MLNREIIYFLLITFTFSLTARGNGVSFEAALGSPGIILQNPGGGEAAYSGLAANGKIYAPLYTSVPFAVNLIFSGRYVDVYNNNNSKSQKETSSHIGLGGGLQFRFYKIITGVNSHVIKGRHFWVGDTNRFEEFNYNMLSYYAGLEWGFSKNFALALTYEMASTELNISDNVIPYAENTIWLNFRFDTGYSVGQFLGLLFK